MGLDPELAPAAQGADRTDILVPRVLALGLGIAVTAATVQTGAHLINEFALDGEIQNLDADAEGNTFTWASSVSIFTAAVGALLGGLLWEHRRRELLVVSGLLAFLSLDESITIHERVGLELGSGVLGLPDYAGVRLWIVLYTPLLLLLAYLLWRSTEQFSSRARTFVLYGTALLAAGVALEAVGLPTKWLEDQGTVWPDTLRIAAEEATELAGWILVATGLVAGVCGALAANGRAAARTSSGG